MTTIDSQPKPSLIHEDDTKMEAGNANRDISSFSGYDLNFWRLPVPELLIELNTNRPPNQADASLGNNNNIPNVKEIICENEYYDFAYWRLPVQDFAIEVKANLPMKCPEDDSQTKTNNKKNIREKNCEIVFNDFSYWCLPVKELLIELNADPHMECPADASQESNNNLQNVKETNCEVVFNDLTYWCLPVQELLIELRAKRPLDASLAKNSNFQNIEEINWEYFLNEDGELHKNVSTESLTSPQLVSDDEILDFVSTLSHLYLYNTSKHDDGTGDMGPANRLDPQKWSMLLDCYGGLIRSEESTFRYTLAASLHEIARVVGPELAGRDLLPFYITLTNDLDEVRVGILKNLSMFVKVLGKEDREKCLHTLPNFLQMENKLGWRFRLDLADQLQLLSEIFEPEDVVTHLWPISLNLVLDNVAEVRIKAVEVVAYFIKQLNGFSKSNSEGGKTSVVEELLLELVKKLCDSDKWFKRQTYASLSGQFLELSALSPNQFNIQVLPYLIDLSFDRVPNVRLVVAKTMQKYVSAKEYYCDSNNPAKETLMRTLRKLHNDPDEDVRFFSTGLLARENEEET